MDVMSDASSNDGFDDVNATQDSAGMDISDDSPFDPVHGINVYSSYQIGKIDFELKMMHAMIKDKNGYFHRLSDGEFILETETGLQQLYRNLYYLFKDDVVDRDGNKTGETVVRKGLFIKQWLRDPQRKEFQNIICDPDNHDPTMKNVWPGFAAEALPEIEDVALVMTLVEPILNHFRNLLYHNEAHVLFVLMWLAFQIQRGGAKTEVALILYGDQGTGKGIVFKWFGECVLGPKLYTQTASADDVMGGHAMALCNKKFLQYDEVQLSDTRGLICRLKNMITENTLKFNPKHKPAFTLKCMMNYLFTTNNQTSMPIEPTDRRFAAFEVSQAKMQNGTYFDELHDHIYQPRVARAFFQYLRDHVDLSGVRSNLSSHRPVTQYYRDMQEEMLTPLCKWLSLLCRGATDGDEGLKADYSRVSANVMQERYKDWLSKNYPKQTEFFKGPNFGKELKNMCCKGMEGRPEGNRFTAGGLTYTRSNGLTYYGFDFDALKEHMAKYRFLDRNID